MTADHGYVLAAIFARGGSKGVYRKNIRPLAGKPLIAYAIETARMSTLIDRVIVSTDDHEIASIARSYGAEVPFIRPFELAQDDSSEWLSWQHAIRAIQESQQKPAIDIFVSVPPTSPLRSVEDIDLCIQKLVETDSEVVITIKQAERNPYFNMVILDEKGYARVLIPPENTIKRRQDAPSVYGITTVAYAARPDFVLNHNSVFDGKIQTVLIPAERAIDIDTELDFQIAEYLLGRRE